LVYSNNGETGQEALRKFDVKSGALAEWDGNEWTIVRRNQFVEVTGPGGIYGNPNPETDPIWATGWDHKSIILGVRNPETGWDFYRLPKASHSYDGAHGWNTEWPRIQDVGTETNPDYLMTMHGMFWRFPETFTAENSAGVRPRSAYLKVIGDFTRWNDRLVFGCDDSAQKEFLNKRKQKGDHIILSEDENAAVWAGTIDDLWEMGKPVGHGGPWKDTNVKAGEPSDPYLIGFYDKRSIEMFHDASEPVTFKIEVEPIGHGPWLLYKELTVEPGGKLTYLFPESFQARWIRCVADKNCLATIWLEYN
jgi:hypothetical protein